MQNEMLDTIYTLVMTPQGQLLSGQYSGVYAHHNSQPVSLYDNLDLATYPPTTALAISKSGDYMIGGVEGGVLYSTDAGQTWKGAQFQLPPSLISCIRLSPQFEQDRTIIVGTLDDGIYRSTDGGESWEPSNIGLFDRQVLCMAVTSDRLLMVGTETGLYQSANLGRLWHAIETPYAPIVITSICHHDDVTIIGTEQGELYAMSQDGVWQQLGNQAFSGTVNAIQSDGQHILILLDDELLYSSDHGNQWSSITGDSHVSAFTAPDGLTSGSQIWFGTHDGVVSQHIIP